MLSNKPIILTVYGDSLGMPRAMDGIYCPHTYSELIKKWYQKKRKPENVYFYNRSHGGSTIQNLFKEFTLDNQYFGDFGERVMVIQSGIVDCAPRPIPPWFRNAMTHMPPLVVVGIKSFLRRNGKRMIRSGMKWNATSSTQYFKIYRRWLKNALVDHSRIYLFNITPIFTKNYEKTNLSQDNHLPGFSKSIVKYNKIIKDVIREINCEKIKLIDIYNLIKESPEPISKFISKYDGHHLTIQGHKLYAQSLIQYEKLCM